MIPMKWERRPVFVPVRLSTAFFHNGMFIRREERTEGTIEKTVTTYVCPQCGYFVLYGYPYKAIYERQET